MVKLLLERGANIEAEDNDGCTSLFHGFYEGVRFYLRLIFLFLACCKENFEILKELLSESAFIDKKRNDGYTCLLLGY